MAEEALARAGLHIDDLNKIRLLEPEVTQHTTEIRDQCKDFLDKIKEFQRIVQSFIEMTERLGLEVEKEKMKAIALRCSLKSVSQQRESQTQQLYALIAEKQLTLERLRSRYESLIHREAEQNELIEQLSMK